MKTATDAAQATQGEGEQGTDGAATQGKPAAKEPKTTLIKHRGRDISVRDEELVPLAQKGFDYDQKVAALNEKKAQIEELDRLHDLAKTNPKFARAFELVMKDPDGVLERYSTQPRQRKDDDDKDDEQQEERTEARRGAPSGEIAELREEIRQLRAAQGTTDGRLSTREAKEAIGDELARYPWLKGKAGEEARERVLERHQRNPRGDSIETLVGAEAHRIKELLTDMKQRELAAADEARSALTAPARRGIPVKTEKPKYTKDSFKNGDVRKGVRHLAQMMGLGRS